MSAIARRTRLPAPAAGLLAAALDDLQADLDELLFLCRSAESELVEAAVELGEASLHAPTRELLMAALVGAADRQSPSFLPDDARGRPAGRSDPGALERLQARPPPGRRGLRARLALEHQMDAGPELVPVIERLRGSHAVVDNTGLSVSQPFALAGGSVRLIVLESLLKYAQLGLDRANAGVIVARGDDAEGLARHR